MNCITCVFLSFAKLAIPAGNIERDGHSLADGELFHVLSDFLNDSHELMAEDVPLLHGWHGVVEQMKIRPANGGRCDLQYHIASVSDDRSRCFCVFYFVFSLPHNSVHFPVLIYIRSCR